jgi:hypothetical protein
MRVLMGEASLKVDLGLGKILSLPEQSNSDASRS